jgi:hypothetical protein
MKIVSIKEILLTGNFGGISLGMFKDSVIDKLGQPILDEFTDDNEAGILKYGRYEFYYWKNNDRIYGFANVWLSALGETKKRHKENINYKNRTFEMDLSFMKIGHISTNREVKQWLLAHKVPFEEKTTYCKNIELCFQSGVILHFIDISWYTFIDDFGKTHVLESLPSTEDFILEGIRQYDFSITKK